MKRSVLLIIFSFLTVFTLNAVSLDCVNYIQVNKFGENGALVAGKGGNPLSEAGKVLDRGGLTKAGRALEKHGGREGSVFPKAIGNVEAKNVQGQQILDEILSSETQMTRLNRFGGQDIFDITTGRGVRYDANGNMMGFLDP